MTMFKLSITIGVMKKMRNKHTSKALIFLVSIACFLLFLVNSINTNTYDSSFYKEYSRKYNIKEYVGVDQDKLEKMYDNIIDQIKTGDDSYLKPYFNDREIYHMDDVHKLYKFADVVKYISIFIILVFLIRLVFEKSKYKRFIFISTLRNSLVAILLIITLLAILISTDFDSAFIKFHHIFFDNDLWILNPKTDIMIRMLPQDYFLKMAIRILTRFLSYIFSLIIILSIYIRIYKKRGV